MLNPDPALSLENGEAVGDFKTSAY